VRRRLVRRNFLANGALWNVSRQLRPACIKNFPSFFASAESRGTTRPSPVNWQKGKKAIFSSYNKRKCRIFRASAWKKIYSDYLSLKNQSGISNRVFQGTLIVGVFPWQRNLYQLTVAHWPCWVTAKLVWALFFFLLHFET
jgi:hypothetical protein